jgi:hypothetical protein
MEIPDCTKRLTLMQPSAKAFGSVCCYLQCITCSSMLVHLHLTQARDSYYSAPLGARVEKTTALVLTCS